jgi:hypothetical protein
VHKPSVAVTHSPGQDIVSGAKSVSAMLMG